MVIRTIVMVLLALALPVRAQPVNYLCPTNQAVGFPCITCQPMDQKLYPSQDAVFEVMAVGQNLSYQWFFQNTNGIFPVANATNAQMVIPAGDCNRCGFYWATVNAGGWLPGQLVDTRMASLTLAQSLSNSTNGIDQELLRLGSNGKAPCCSGYCGFINFYNGGSGWQISAGQQFTFSVVQVATGQNLATGNYCVQWTSTTGASGCCTVSSLTDMKLIAPAGAIYVFTVYIKGNCPPAGTAYDLVPH